MFNWSDKVYKWVKWSVLLLIPTLGLAYQKLGAIWGFPLIEQVKATIDVVVYCLAVVLGINCAEYDSTKAKLQAQLDSVQAEPIEEKSEAKEQPQVEPTSAENAQVEPTISETETVAETEVTEVTSQPSTSVPTTEEVVPTVVPTESVQATEEERGIGGTCICEVNKSYNLTYNVKVRESYGTDARWLKRDELTEDGKAHSLDGEYAVLANGTEVFCQEIYKNWIKIPSGWICARDMDGTENVAVQSNKWCYPVDYIGISTPFSYEHMAYDFGWSDEGGGKNCNIYSTCNGTVLATGEAGTAGKYIYVGTEQDGQYYTFRYCHLSAIHVSPGQSVSRHQHIGQMGGTGGFAEHLHMDLWTGRYDGVMPSDRWAACRNYMLSVSGEGHELLFLADGQWAGDTTGQNYVFDRL